MTLDRAGKTPALRTPDHVNHLAVRKLIDQHLVADVHPVAAFVQTELFEDSRRGNATASFLEVPAHRLADILQLRWLLIHQNELHRLVSVRNGCRLLFHDDTWASLDYRHWRHCAVRRKDLRHADFSSDDPVNHDFNPANRSYRPYRTYLYCLPKALISTSTPAGKSSFINASTVCGVGSRMSISRL